MEEENTKKKSRLEEENEDNIISTILLLVLSVYSFSIVVMYKISGCYGTCKSGTLDELVDILVMTLPLAITILLIISRFFSEIKTSKYNNLTLKKTERLRILILRILTGLFACVVIVLTVLHSRYMVSGAHGVIVIALLTIFSGITSSFVLYGIWVCLGSKKLIYGKKREKWKLNLLALLIAVLVSFLIVYTVFAVEIFNVTASLMEPYLGFYFPSFVSIFSLILAILVILMKTIDHNNPILGLNA